MRLLLVVLAAATLSGSTARAAPGETSGAEPSAAALKEAALTRFDEGVRLYAKRKYTRAYVAFLQAYSLTKNPVILGNLAQSALRSQHPLEALHYFQRYVRELRGLTARQKARAQRGIEEARQELGSILISAPEGADISVDGDDAGRAPLDEPVDVLPGEHQVKISTHDANKAETVRVAPGEKVTIKLAVAGASAPRERERETVVAPVESPDEPAPPPPPPPPREAPGFFTAPASTGPAIVAGGVGLIALTTAFVLGGIRLNADGSKATASSALVRNGHDPSECASTPATDPTIGATCATLNRSQETLNQLSAPSIAALVVGGGATVFALGWYFFAPKAAPAGPTTGFLRNITPTVGPGMTGAMLRMEY